MTQITIGYDTQKANFLDMFGWVQKKRPTWVTNQHKPTNITGRFPQSHDIPHGSSRSRHGHDDLCAIRLEGDTSRRRSSKSSSNESTVKRGEFGGFPEMVVPQNGWFMRENPIKMDDDWGYPYFRTPPCGISPWNSWRTRKKVWVSSRIMRKSQRCHPKWLSLSGIERHWTDKKWNWWTNV